MAHMDRFLNPSYLSTDFETSVERLRKLMEESDTFRDYNYEGSNISMLIELISYLNDMSTYYNNKLAKNIFPESAEIYETAHSTSSIRGYRPKGTIAPHLNLEVSITVDSSETTPSSGEQLYVPAWFRVDTDLQTPEGNKIVYTTTKDYTFKIPDDFGSGTYTFTLPMKEGNYQILNFTGEDIISNKIILPFYTFDFDTIPYDENPGLVVYVNGEPWIRVREFSHQYIDGETDIYVFEYDKYERYNLIFSPSHNMPGENDNITVILNRTHGPNGDIYSGALSDFDMVRDTPVLDNGDLNVQEQRFINNLTRNVNISEDAITVNNPDSSFNSSSPESIEEIKTNSRTKMFSQYRNNNARDYREHLQEHPDIVKGNAWGEQEINPQNTEEYNKVYISVIPTEFDSTTIETSATYWDRDDLDYSVEIDEITGYNSTFKDNVFQHISSRKMLGIYEILTLPEIVYFAFDIGIAVRRSYNFVNVKEEVKRKLNYYFMDRNREFNEIIDFKDLHNFILDLTVRDENNEKFNLIRGVRNLIIRDILTYTPSLSSPETIYEPNDVRNYPQYTIESLDVDYANVLRPIKLGLNQFPSIVTDNCIFINEG